MKPPYERIVQWTAGPIAIIAGWGATLLTSHLSFLGKGVTGHSQVAHAIVGGLTFLVGAGVTYAAHHKWLDNLSKWWTTDASKVEASVTGVVAQIDPAAAPELKTGIDDVNAMVNEILTNEAAAATIQEMPGKPEDEIAHGLPSVPFDQATEQV